jgi:hypothetical protein
MVLVLSLLVSTAVINVINTIPARQSHPPFRGPLQNIGGDFEAALAGAAGNATRSHLNHVLNDDVLPPAQYEAELNANTNGFLGTWHQSILSQLAGYAPRIRLDVRTNASVALPAGQDNASSLLVQWNWPAEDNGTLQGIGYTRVNGSAFVDLPGVGFSGYGEERTLWLNVTIPLNEIVASQGLVAFNMTVVREGGVPVETLDIADVQVLVLQEGASERTLAALSEVALAYRGNGVYRVSVLRSSIVSFRVGVTDDRGMVVSAWAIASPGYNPPTLERVFVKQIQISRSGDTVTATITVNRRLTNGTDVVAAGAQVYGHFTGATELTDIENAAPLYTDASGMVTTTLDVESSGWSSPTSAYADDGSSTSATTPSAAHRFYGFNLAIPGGDAITQVTFRVERSRSGADAAIDFEVSPDGGITWLPTYAQDMQALTSGSSVWTVNVTGWTAWTPSMLNGDTLQTRVSFFGAGTYSIDYVALDVTSTSGSVSAFVSKEAVEHLQAESYVVDYVQWPVPWEDPTNAFASDGSRATGDVLNARHQWYGFNFGLANGTTINTVELLIEQQRSSGASSPYDLLEVSTDSGFTWLPTTATNSSSGTSDSLWVVDITSWDTWTTARLNNDTFRMRLTRLGSAGSVDVDHIQLRVNHSAGVVVTNSASKETTDAVPYSENQLLNPPTAPLDYRHLPTQFGGLTGNATTGVFVKKGSFTKTTSGAPVNQAITGVGFQPQAIIFFWTRQTATGLASAVHAGYGFTTGTTNERGIAIASDDGAGTSNTGRRQSQQRMIILLSSGSPSLAAQAELNSMDPDGFTVRWTTNDARADIIHYIAIGGPGVTDALAGTFTAVSGAGSQSITGLGFRPSFLMTISIDSTTYDSGVSVGKAALGFASGPTARGTVSVTLEDGQGTSDTWVRQRNDRFISELTDSGGDDMLADLTSFDADGFTINKSTADATDIHYLALAGPQFNVGAFNKVTGAAPASQSVTGVGFEPIALLLASKDLATSTSIVSEGRISFGATDGTTQGATWFHDDDGLGITDANMRTSTSRTAVHGSASSLNAEAAFTSFDPDGFTLNWNPNNAVAEEVLYVAIGNSTAAPPSTWSGTLNVFYNEGANTSYAETNATSVTAHWYGFGFSLPSNGTVVAVSLETESRKVGGSSPSLLVEVSVNGGSTWLASTWTYSETAASFNIHTQDITAWTTWNSSVLNGDVIWVRITCTAGCASTFRLDYLAVRVEYSVIFTFSP